MLTLIRDMPSIRYVNQTKTVGLYRCDCGNEKVVAKQHVRSGRTISCGCASKENAKKHGMSKTKTYRIWTGMKSRIHSNDPNQECYKDIGISKSWMSFENFLKDMGECPEGMEIDRINPTKGYSKNNCRWATRQQQMLNQRRNYKIFKKYNELDPIVSYKMFRNRIRRGWDLSKAAHTPKMVNQFK